MISKILWACMAIVLFSMASADYDAAQYCQLVPQGTKFPSLDSCQKYYTCQSPTQVTVASCPSNQVFNKDYQACVAPGNGNCNIDLGNPCQNIDGKWVTDPKDCRVWHYCQNGKILGSGSCSSGQIFDYSAQRCVNGKCPSNGSGTGNNDGISNLCIIMQSGKFFGDFANCKIWHKCDGLDEKSGSCPNGLIYDPQQRMCIYSKDNTCGGPAEECNSDNKDKQVANSKICSNYFVCTKQGTEWAWEKKTCTNNKYFNPSTNSCLSRQAATPVSTCDRCQYSSLQWVNAVDPKCQKYYICQNGVEIQSGTCKTGYFNEQMQSCVEGSSLKNYSQTNGACATASNVKPTEEPTDAPGTGTEKPTDAPGTGTEKPTDAPGTGTEKPTDAPGTGTEKPTDAPGTGTEKPTDAPGTGTEKPTDAPGTGTEKPTDAPGTGTEKPTDAPGTGTEKPTDAPGTGTEKPTEPETKPTEPETKPTEPETKPTEPETKPTESETEKPGETDPEKTPESKQAAYNMYNFLRFFKI